MSRRMLSFETRGKPQRRYMDVREDVKLVREVELNGNK